MNFGPNFSDCTRHIQMCILRNSKTLINVKFIKVETYVVQNMKNEQKR